MSVLDFKVSPGNSDYARVAEAIRFLRTHSPEQPDLQRLAAHLGLSASHCHRLFHRWAGVTPKDFIQIATLQRAREALRSRATVLEAAVESGLSGPGRLHDLCLKIEAATPGEMRALGRGLEIQWSVHPTPLGPAFFAVTSRGLCALYFLTDEEPVDAALLRLRGDWPRASIAENPTSAGEIAQELARRMRGELKSPLSLVLRGTPFQIKVWEALLRIPLGAVASYGEIAREVCSSAAVRAVGGAIGANRMGYLIPCHRVLRSGGMLGGYRWGEERKVAALVLEAGRKR